MKRLVDFYLQHLDCTNRRSWKKWPFHKVYNQYTEKNGDVDCVDKWRKCINEYISHVSPDTDFTTLHCEISKLAQTVYGIGPLHIYDTAICFRYPTVVYLHSGTKIAANAMGIYGHTAEKSKITAKYPELEILTPLQLEDFLCICKDVFIGNKTSQAQLTELQQSRGCCIERKSCY